LLGAGRAEEIAGGKNIDSRYFEIGGEHAPRVMHRFTGKVRCENTRLFVRRLDQSVADPAMLSAFPDRIDAGPACLQKVVDQNAAIDAETGAVGEFDIGANAGSDHHEIGFDFRPVLERNNVYAIFTADCDCFGFQKHRNAARFERPFQ
jgi:hypothetical protein